MLKRCSKCKEKKEGVGRVGSIQLCRKCREARETPKISGRGDRFLPPELRAMAKDMGLEDQLERIDGVDSD